MEGKKIEVQILWDEIDKVFFIVFVKELDRVFDILVFFFLISLYNIISIKELQLIYIKTII